ncbi:MAG: methionine--tRNA ligase [Chlamydiales bacterium]|nr:methionine--tRNA ligase [Chlamydiales bacterium]
MTKKILITAALPYANGPLHFGHMAGAYLPADIYSRFIRQKHRDTLFICGSDEYGIAVVLSAELAKRSPQEHVDQFHAVNKDLFAKMNIVFDHFSRTTWPGHSELTHQYFTDLLYNGYIEEKETEQLYSEQEGRFLADRYVVGTCPKCGFVNARGDECTSCAASFDATDLINPRSKLTGSPLIRKKTTHWFLRLDLFKDKLLAWLATKNWKSNVVNFIKGYIQDLHPRAITRDMTWGIPIPIDGITGKVLYVWFDAPIGYLSATKEWAELRGEPNRWKDYWCDENTHLVQFVGKDNIPFHAAIFPAMTMGQNQPFKLVDELPANEFYNLEGRQFSKSDGWYIDLAEFLTKYTADQLRYTIASNAPENSDSEFTWRDFQIKCNSDLVGKFGNFIHRTLVFLQNNCQQKVPSRGALDEIDTKFLQDLAVLMVRIEEAYSGFHVRQASGLLMEIAALGNVYFDAKKPWKLAKSEDTKAEMNTCIALCVECIKQLALAASPILPETSEKIWEMLDMTKPTSWDSRRAEILPEGKVLSTPKTLFTKIEDEQIAQEIALLTANEKPQSPVAPPVVVDEKPLTPLSSELINFEDVKKLDLRVATIVSAERVPKSKKLLKLEVDIGLEKRTVVSGIGHQFAPETLIGKQVVLVANLKPTTLMGVESQGMILAGASPSDTLQLVELNNLPRGSTVS